jgi:predicted RNase H-like nuclease (RuvC/YqgF family)
MREGQKRVNVYIPDDLYSRVLTSEYNMTEAVIAGLRKLLDPDTEALENKEDRNIPENTSSLNTELIENLQVQIKTLEDRLSKVPEPSEFTQLQERTEEQKARIEEYKVQVQALNAEITRLKNVLMEAPDPVDLVRLQERNDGLNLVIEEKNKRIEDLTREVTTLNGFAHYFKTAEVKQIEAPATEKKSFISRFKFW